MWDEAWEKKKRTADQVILKQELEEG
jgi:hypothetical protein